MTTSREAIRGTVKIGALQNQPTNQNDCQTKEKNVVRTIRCSTESKANLWHDNLRFGRFENKGGCTP